MAINGNYSERLTHRQKRAITALLASKDVKAAAEVAKIGERTLYRWMTQERKIK
jgi:transcriptional regulator with PAS, ATPase and Fis domain